MQLYQGGKSIFDPDGPYWKIKDLVSNILNPHSHNVLPFHISSSAIFLLMRFLLFAAANVVVLFSVLLKITLADQLSSALCQ